LGTFNDIGNFCLIEFRKLLMSLSFITPTGEEFVQLQLILASR